MVPRILLGALGNRKQVRLVGSTGRCRGRLVLRGFAGQPHGLTCYVQFRSTGTACQLLDLCAVLISGGEIHGRESRNAPKGFVHQTDALEESRPVDGRHPSHARDDVPNRDVRRSLSLVCLGDYFRRGRPLCSQSVTKPVEGKRDRRWLVTQPLHELHGERTVERPVTQQSQDVFHSLRGLITETQKAIRHVGGVRARLAGPDDQLR